MNRKQRRQVAEATVECLESGMYRYLDEVISFQADLQESIQQTVDYPPEVQIRHSSKAGQHCLSVRVQNVGALEAAKALLDSGASKVCVLNFASAYSPGGGFLSGSQAQEEALARCSGLYASLRTSGMYAYHREQDDTGHSTFAVYSPSVPVFRDSAGTFLSEPWRCSFVSCAAPRKSSMMKEGRANEADGLMELRIRRVLSLMENRGYESIVLGAWGCGVFGNEARTVAAAFDEALNGEFSDCFSSVLFAVLDFGEPPCTFEEFRRSLDDGGE